MSSQPRSAAHRSAEHPLYAMEGIEPRRARTLRSDRRSATMSVPDRRSAEFHSAVSQNFILPGGAGSGGSKLA